jgi:putative FmdB family regulatory protein
MPTYEYECTKCKCRFEVFQSMNDEHVKECAKCSGKVKRLIGAGAGIIFKGAGFYVNDYKNSNSSGGQKNKSKPDPVEGTAGAEPGV